MAAPAARQVQVEYLPLNKVREARANPKDHDIPALIISMHSHGFVAPLIMDEKSKRLVAGHGRLEALRTMRSDGQDPPKGVHLEGAMWMVPVVRGVSFPSIAAAEAYLLADNRITELGGWQDAELLEMLQEMQAAELLEQTAFTDEDILALLQAAEGKPLPPEADDIPERPTPRSSPGDVWLCGDHRVLCADATEAASWETLMDGQLAEMVFTDPPYGVDIGAKNTYLNSIARSNRVEETMTGDALDEDNLLELLRLSFAGAATASLAGAAWYVAAPAGPLHLLFGKALNELGIWHQTIQWVKEQRDLLADGCGLPLAGRTLVLWMDARSRSSLLRRTQADDGLGDRPTRSVTAARIDEARSAHDSRHRELESTRRAGRGPIPRQLEYPHRRRGHRTAMLWDGDRPPLR